MGEPFSLPMWRLQPRFHRVRNLIRILLEVMVGFQPSPFKGNEDFRGLKTFGSASRKGTWRRGSESNEASPTTTANILMFKGEFTLILQGFKQLSPLSAHYRR